MDTHHPEIKCIATEIAGDTISRATMSTVLHAQKIRDVESAFVLNFDSLTIGSTHIDDSDEGNAPAPLPSKYLPTCIDYINAYMDGLDDDTADTITFPSFLTAADLVNIINAADYLLLPELVSTTAQKLADMTRGLLHPDEVALRMLPSTDPLPDRTCNDDIGSRDSDDGCTSDDSICLAMTKVDSGANNTHSARSDGIGALYERMIRNTAEGMVPSASAILDLEMVTVATQLKTEGAADIDPSDIEAMTGGLWEVWRRQLTATIAADVSSTSPILSDLKSVEGNALKCLRYLSQVSDGALAQFFVLCRNIYKDMDDMVGHFILLDGSGLESAGKDVVLNMIAYANTYVSTQTEPVNLASEYLYSDRSGSSNSVRNTLIESAVCSVRVWLNILQSHIPSGSFLTKVVCTSNHKCQALGVAGYHLQKRLLDVYYSPNSGAHAMYFKAADIRTNCKDGSRINAINEAVRLVFMSRVRSQLPKPARRRGSGSDSNSCKKRKRSIDCDEATNYVTTLGSATRVLCAQGFRVLVGKLFSGVGVGWTPADACVAAASGNIEILQEIYASPGGPLLLESPYNNTTDPTVLPCAARKDKYRCAATLIAEMGNSTRRATPLIHAVVNEQQQTAEWLVYVAGVDPNGIAWKHCEQFSLFHNSIFTKTPLSTICYTIDANIVNRINALLLLLKLGATVEMSKIELKKTIYLYNLNINERIFTVLETARVSVWRSQDNGIECTLADWAKRISSTEIYNAWMSAGMPDWMEWHGSSGVRSHAEEQMDEYYARRGLQQLSRPMLQDKAIELGIRPYQVSSVLIDEIFKKNFGRNMNIIQQDKKRKT